MALVFSLSLSVQPAVAASDDFKILGPARITLGIGDDYQLDYITGGVPYEFMSGSIINVKVDQNGLLHCLKSGSALILLRSLENSSVGSTIQVIVSSSSGQSKYAVSYFPGTQGAFHMQVNNGLAYGDPTPAFTGVPIGNLGYAFTGWSSVPSATVTGTVTYVAEWEEIQDSGFSSSTTIDAVTGDEYKIAVSAELMSEYNGSEIVLEYDDTVFAVVSMNTLTTEVAFTQVSPGAVKFVLDITNPAGTLDLLSLGAIRTENGFVQMYN
jgi:hypothetical protein